MILQNSPNCWSCMAASFATALGISVEEVIRHVGHDGSDIIHIGNDPERRRGFHPQEMIDLCLELDENVVAIEAAPCFARPNGYGSVPIEIIGGNDKRIRGYLHRNHGVLTGLNSIGKPHAVYWDGEMIHCPSKMCSYELNYFQLQVFYKFP